MAISKNHYETEQPGVAWLPHPAAMILLWVSVTIAMQPMHVPALLLSGGILVMAALRLSVGRFVTLLRRTRWIMLSLLLIYGYATAGTAVWPQGGLLSPTREGLLDGLLQLSRLVFALAGLSIMLGMLSREQLVGGLYVLAWPLRYVGLSRERIAVRLALTLHYAESAMLDTASDWRASISGMLQPVEPDQHEIELHAAPLMPRDGLVLAAAATVLLVALL